MSRELFDQSLERVCQAQGWKRSGDEVTIPTDNGREQRVVLDPFEFEGEPLVRLSSAIGSSLEIEPLHLNKALRLNYGLPHGALALRGDQLVMVDTLMVNEPDDAEIEAVVSYLAEIADQFEASIFGPDEN